MLITCGRVIVRTTGLNALKTLPIYKSVSPATQCLPTTTRALATAAVPKKVATTTTTKKPVAAATTKAKVPVKKPTATTTTKKTPTKQVAAKPAATKASVKTATKTVASKDAEDKPVAKPRPRAAAKTDEEKQKEHIKDLVEKALEPPSLRGTSSSWVAFMREKWASEKEKGTAGLNVVKSMQEHGSEWVNEYKALSPAQLEALSAKEETKKDDIKKSLDQWVNSHTPLQIYKANVARRALRRIQNKAKESNEPVPKGLKTKSFLNIPDARYPARAKTAHLFYVSEKMAGLPAEKKVEAMIQGMKEFKDLPEAEQKKYKDMAVADRERYRNALRSIGVEPSTAED